MLLAKAVHPITGLAKPQKLKRPAAKKSSLFSAGTEPLQQIARALVELGGQMTYFKLTKLLYLVDLTAIRSLGQMVAADVYLRQVDGPWIPKLEQALRGMEGRELRWFFSRKLPMVALGPSPRVPVQLDDDILEIVAQVYDTYGQLSNSEIKTAVYQTEPMRYILQQEKTGRDMRNKAVLYKGKTAADLGRNRPST